MASFQAMRWLLPLLAFASSGCTAIVDASGLTDEWGREDATLDTATDTAVIDTFADDVVVVDAPESGHDCEARLRGDKRYLLCKDELTYEQAEIVCRTEFGAHLVVIHDETEQAFLHAWLFARKNAWIGLDDRKKELEYIWVDGTTPTYLNWQTGPSAEDYNDCVWMQTGGTWADRLCNASNTLAWYFCESP